MSFIGEHKFIVCLFGMLLIHVFVQKSHVLLFTPIYRELYKCMRLFETVTDSASESFDVDGALNQCTPLDDSANCVQFWRVLLEIFCNIPYIHYKTIIIIFGLLLMNILWWKVVYFWLIAIESPTWLSWRTAMPCCNYYAL